MGFVLPFLCSFLFQGFSAQASAVDFSIIVRNGCSAVADREMISSAVSDRCFARGSSLEREWPRAQTLGQFVLRLCGSLPLGGLLRENYQLACFEGVARDSLDPRLESLYETCSFSLLLRPEREINDCYRYWFGRL